MVLSDVLSTPVRCCQCANKEKAVDLIKILKLFDSDRQTEPSAFQLHTHTQTGWGSFKGRTSIYCLCTSTNGSSPSHLQSVDASVLSITVTVHSSNCQSLPVLSICLQEPQTSQHPSVFGHMQWKHPCPSGDGVLSTGKYSVLDILCTTVEINTCTTKQEVLWYTFLFAVTQIQWNHYVFLLVLTTDPVPSHIHNILLNAWTLFHLRGYCSSWCWQ